MEFRSIQQSRMTHDLLKSGIAVKRRDVGVPRCPHIAVSLAQPPTSSPALASPSASSAALDCSSEPCTPLPVSFGGIGSLLPSPSSALPHVDLGQPWQPQVSFSPGAAYSSPLGPSARLRCDDSASAPVSPGPAEAGREQGTGAGCRECVREGSSRGEEGSYWERDADMDEEDGHAPAGYSSLPCWAQELAAEAQQHSKHAEPHSRPPPVVVLDPSGLPPWCMPASVPHRQGAASSGQLSPADGVPTWSVRTWLPWWGQEEEQSKMEGLTASSLAQPEERVFLVAH